MKADTFLAIGVFVCAVALGAIVLYQHHRRNETCGGRYVQLRVGYACVGDDGSLRVP